MPHYPTSDLCHLGEALSCVIDFVQVSLGQRTVRLDVTSRSRTSFGCSPLLGIRSLGEFVFGYLEQSWGRDYHTYSRVLLSV